MRHHREGKSTSDLFSLTVSTVFLTSTHYFSDRWGPQPTYRYKFTLAEWAKDPEVQKAWTDLSKEYGLRDSPFERGPEKTESIFTFGDGGLTFTQPIEMR